MLATVPNMNVLLNDVLFLEVLQPSELRYTFKIRLAKNFGTSFVSYQNFLVIDNEIYTCNILDLPCDPGPLH